MVIAKIKFNFYHDGIHPTHYQVGDELPEDAAKVALAEGWATREEPKKSEKKGK